MKRILAAGACGCLWLSSGAVAAPSAEQPAPVAPSEAAGAPAPDWQLLTRTVEQRLVEFAQFGSGPRQVLVIGPLQGDQTEGVDFANRLAVHMSRFPRRAMGCTLTVVRDPNPDGRARGTAANLRGVLLDQNFHTARWRKIPAGERWSSGRSPQSEPEVQALAELLDDIKPDCLILLRTARQTAGLTFSGPAEDLAREVALAAGVGTESERSPAPGSLAIYAGQDRKIPTLVLSLPPRVDADRNWSHFKRAVLATLGDGGADEPTGAAGLAAGAPVPTARSLNSSASAPTLPPDGAGPASAPVHTVSGPPISANRAGAPALSPAPAPSRPEPQADRSVLPYTSLEKGGVVVSVTRPAAAKKSAPRSTKPLAGTTTGPRQLERLPPVEGPARPPVTLPQTPIPIYPDTGY